MGLRGSRRFWISLWLGFGLRRRRWLRLRFGLRLLCSGRLLSRRRALGFWLRCWLRLWLSLWHRFRLGLRLWLWCWLSLRLRFRRRRWLFWLLHNWGLLGLRGSRRLWISLWLGFRLRLRLNQWFS